MKKPTIAELEEILEGPPRKLEILPGGEIVVGNGKCWGCKTELVCPNGCETKTNGSDEISKLRHECLDSIKQGEKFYFCEHCSLTHTQDCLKRCIVEGGHCAQDGPQEI